MRVLHRPGKQGLGKAYVDGFGVALDGARRRIVQMDADWSHDPDGLPALVGALEPVAAARTARTSSSARAKPGAAAS